MSSDVKLAYATFPDAATAERVCTTLVTERLVTCANILGGHTSIYHWDERLQRAAEVGAILKFSSGLADRLARRFVELHPYEVPALVYLDVTGGHAAFLNWVAGK